jgi:hypothetical protein
MRFYTLALGTALLASAALAQVVSGPEKGSAVQPVKVFAATGPNESKELDYAAERKDKPTIYVLIREFDRPVGRYIKTLDTGVKEDNPEAHVVAVWLTDQQEQTKTYLPRVQQSIKLEATSMTVFTGDKNGPDNWNLNPDARVTTVVVVKGKVAQTFGYASVNDTEVPAVREALKKAVAGQ